MLEETSTSEKFASSFFSVEVNRMSVWLFYSSRVYGTLSVTYVGVGEVI